MYDVYKFQAIAPKKNTSNAGLETTTSRFESRALPNALRRDCDGS